MDKIIDFFKKNKGQVVDFIDSIMVNHFRPTVKYSYKENEGISLVFYIHDEFDYTISDFEEKIHCLFNIDSVEIKEIENMLDTVTPCTINISPFLKISDNPLTHAFQITIKSKEY